MSKPEGVPISLKFKRGEIFGIPSVDIDVYRQLLVELAPHIELTSDMVRIITRIVPDGIERKE